MNSQDESGTTIETRKIVVILGDWYIDDHWLVSPQHSYHSSTTGDIHYLARHKDAMAKVTALCGAPAVLRAIMHYKPKSNESQLGTCFEFQAFGVWNPWDDELIHRLLHGGEDLHLSPYTLTHGPEGESVQESVQLEGSTIHNLARSANEERWSEFSTNRIYRCFQSHGGDTPRVIYRLDWMLPLTDEQGEEKLKYSKSFADLADKDVVAVILIDHGAGVVNPESIKALKEALGVDGDKQQGGKEILWFIRTKIDNPSWLDCLNDQRIEMLVLNEKLATHLKGARKWLYEGSIGRAALEILGESSDVYTYEHGKQKKAEPGIRAKSTAVLLDDNTVFALVNENAADDEEATGDGDATGDEVDDSKIRCIWSTDPPGKKHLVRPKRTTVFAAALFAQRLYALSKKIPGTETEGLPPLSEEECQNAVQWAYKWSGTISDHWKRTGEFLFASQFEAALKSIDSSDEGIPKVQCEGEDYKTLWKWWNRSSRDLGIVEVPKATKEPGAEPKTERTLQIWRAKGVLKDFVCVGGPKRDRVNDLVTAVSRYAAEKDPSHSFCCLIHSPPGWGKSFLAKQLADHLDFHFLEFSIAQMSDPRDLIDAFASIASSQSRTRERTLVFIDEINAEIAGHSVTPLLLSPLWGGTFVKDRMTFRLTPGVWVFASTDTPEKFSEGEKGSDFLSRLNGPIINVGSPRRWMAAIEEARGFLAGAIERRGDVIYGGWAYERFISEDADPAKTELVYLMVNLLDSLWTPIEKVKRSVLQLFHDLLPINGFRSLEIFASRFVDIQRGEVWPCNIPDVRKSEELSRHIILPQYWPRTVEDDEFIKIEMHSR